MNRNKKIAIGFGLALLATIFAYKKGVFSKDKATDDTSGSSSTDTGATSTTLPVVDVSSGSETPQVAVVNIPPQFGGAMVANVNVPATTGSWQSFN